MKYDKAKGQEAIEWLTAEAHQRGSTEGTFFEEVGLMPLADPPAVEAGLGIQAISPGECPRGFLTQHAGTSQARGQEHQNGDRK